MARINAVLSGGLGNQMFQYAAARALALRTGAELRLDTWSGFARDYEYRRQFELASLPIRGRTLSRFQSLPVLASGLHRRVFASRPSAVKDYWYGRFIDDTPDRYVPDLEKSLSSRTTWLRGYWQSPKYFEDFAQQIYRELCPSAPADPRFLTLGDEMAETESVALGIRLYEESSDPSAHARDRTHKTVKDLRQAIATMHLECPSAKWFVFCTHHSPILGELALPGTPRFVTHDEGYEGSLERLWLLSRCRHHVFNNSTFYWWGAWLSGADSGSQRQYVLAANNFVNKDSICAGWSTF